MSPSELFSIDVDAHLKKAATHTFGSPSHYPVELVRAALRRGARHIDIRITKQYVEVQDDGEGLNEKDLHMLIAVMEPNQPAEKKEEAVEALQNRKNFGLLALFAPSPEKITVETISPDCSPQKKQFVFQKGTLRQQNACNLPAGTRITLHAHKHRDMAREKQVITTYCKWSDKEIRLDKRLVSGGNTVALTKQLATMRLKNSAYSPKGILGIPRTGDLCRIRLLDCGIPYRYVTAPIHKGFVFEAAIEFVGDIKRHLLNTLAEQAAPLYTWLCNQHAASGEPVRERIEALIFTHYRLTWSPRFLKRFSPFPLFGSNERLSLEQIKKEATDSSVYAVPRGKEKLRYPTGGRCVLLLSREQADFLINLHGIPITFLSPLYRRENPLKKLFHRLKRFLKTLPSHLAPSPSLKNALPPSRLSGAEGLFMETLNNYIQKAPQPFEKGSKIAKAVMAPGRRGFPSAIATESKKNHTSHNNKVLIVKRYHRWILEAIRAVEENPDNIEMVIPMLKR